MVNPIKSILMEKVICAQCGKEDLKECVVKDGKTFCCAVCSQEYTKAHPDEEEGEQEKNICTFC